jgi:hypothetical protein
MTLYPSFGTTAEHDAKEQQHSMDSTSTITASSKIQRKSKNSSQTNKLILCLEK